MSENEFWQTEPHVFEAFVTRWKKKTRRESERFASLMAQQANLYLGPDEVPYTAADFFRDSAYRRRREERARRIKEELAFFEGLVAAGLAEKVEKPNAKPNKN